MMITKFWGAYQTLPYSVLTFRLLQGLFFIRFFLYYLSFLIGGALWPFYFFYRVWRKVAHKEPFAKADEPWMPWGVKGGQWLNLAFFLVLYIGMPVMGAINEKHRLERLHQPLITPYPVTESDIKPYVPPSPDEIDTTFDFSAAYDEAMRKSRKEHEHGGYYNDADRYNDEADNYADDPEDEITYPPEIFDASDD